ncbi:hypothetical protein OROGR_020372 [Orobanche gracilis]
MPVVGGTGQFRLAQGYAVVSTHSTGADNNGVLEYCIYLYYYQRKF